MTLQVSVGTQIRFIADTGFNPADDGTNETIGTPTDYTLTLSGVADGAGRQSDKADLGANRAAAYEVKAAVDFTGETPTAGGTIDYYWLPSGSGTTADGNVAGNSGIDAAAPGGAVPGALTVDEFAAMGQYIGSLTVSDDAAVQNDDVVFLSSCEGGNQRKDE